MKEYDECQSPDHGCEHECTNTLGNFRFLQFYLAQDGNSLPRFVLI